MLQYVFVSVQAILQKEAADIQRQNHIRTTNFI